MDFLSYIPKNLKHDKKTNKDKKDKQKDKDTLIKINELMPDKTKFICSGKFGIIYVAKDHQEYVIKVIKCDTVRFLMEEHPLLIDVTRSHDNLVTILDSIWKPKLKELWVYMDNLPGKDLFDYICSTRPRRSLFSSNTGFSLIEIISITKQLLEAINHLHKNGIIHRDVKPENIRIIHKEDNKPPNYHVMLYDFGLSEFKIRKNTNNKISGTVDFLAPELFKDGNYDEKIDIWSLGSTIYYMIVGVPPVESLKIPVQDIHHLADSEFHNMLENRLMLKCGSKRVTEICLNMLSIDPKTRPSARELLLNSVFDYQ